MLIGALKAEMIRVYIWYKFGEFLSSNYGVQLCTAGVDWHSG